MEDNFSWDSFIQKGILTHRGVSSNACLCPPRVVSLAGDKRSLTGRPTAINPLKIIYGLFQCFQPEVLG